MSVRRLTSSVDHPSWDLNRGAPPTTAWRRRQEVGAASWTSARCPPGAGVKIGPVYLSGSSPPPLQKYLLRNFAGTKSFLETASFFSHGVVAIILNFQRMAKEGGHLTVSHF